MNDTANIGFPEAARQLGVSLRVLRHAIRAGKISAPAQNGATARLSTEWLAQAKATVQATPGVLNRAFTQKVAPFARYEGTSCWRKYLTRVRDYNNFRATAA
jgi:aryl-alcohol dehydrogenase-like predicted oxidoreductase